MSDNPSGFTLAMWTGLLQVKPAQLLTARLVRPGDSFRAHMILNALCSVLLISLVLTVVGTWIGTRRISTEPLEQFAHLWPRNCTIAFLIEALLAQPVAPCLPRHGPADLRQRGVDFCSTWPRAAFSAVP